VVYGVLLKPLPYATPTISCLLWKSVPKKNLDHDWTSYPTYLDWKRDSRNFTDLAAFLRPDGSIADLTGTDNVEQLQSTKVSENFFSVLGMPALLGRTFTASEVAAPGRRPLGVCWALSAAQGKSAVVLCEHAQKCLLLQCYRRRCSAAILPLADNTTAILL
jgi:hypothetical protein